MFQFIVQAHPQPSYNFVITTFCTEITLFVLIYHFVLFPASPLKLQRKLTYPWLTHSRIEVFYYHSTLHLLHILIYYISFPRRLGEARSTIDRRLEDLSGPKKCMFYIYDLPMSHLTIHFHLLCNLMSLPSPSSMDHVDIQPRSLSLFIQKMVPSSRMLYVYHRFSLLLTIYLLGYSFYNFVFS